MNIPHNIDELSVMDCIDLLSDLALENELFFDEVYVDRKSFIKLMDHLRPNMQSFGNSPYSTYGNLVQIVTSCGNLPVHVTTYTGTCSIFMYNSESKNSLSINRLLDIKATEELEKVLFDEQDSDDR